MTAPLAALRSKPVLEVWPSYACFGRLRVRACALPRPFTRVCSACNIRKPLFGQTMQNLLRDSHLCQYTSSHYLPHSMLRGILCYAALQIVTPASGHSWPSSLGPRVSPSPYYRLGAQDAPGGRNHAQCRVRLLRNH